MDIVVRIPDQNTLIILCQMLGVESYTTDIKTGTITVDFNGKLKKLNREITEVLDKTSKRKVVEKDEVLHTEKEEVGDTSGKVQRTKKCPICKEVFVPNGKQKYCNDCKTKYGEHCTQECRRREQEAGGAADK